MFTTGVALATEHSIVIQDDNYVYFNLHRNSNNNHAYFSVCLICNKYPICKILADIGLRPRMTYKSAWL